jgi:integrase/recombinase XerD
MDLEEDGLAKHDVIVEYFETKEADLSSDVLDLNRRVLGYFFVETFPELAPKDTTTEHVREFLDRLESQNLEYNSKRRYLEALSSFFSYALQQKDIEYITFNPPGVVLEEYPRYPRTE